MYKTSVSKPGIFITQDLNKIKKIPTEHLIVDIGKQETCAKF